jgi:outer membrane receptor protein involved in Fe transport
MRTWFRSTVCGGASLALTLALLPAVSHSQTALPQVNVEAAKKKPPKRAATRPPTPLPIQQATVTPEVSPAQAVADKNAVFDQKRAAILAPIGANSYEITHSAIEALPGATNTPIDKVLLQAPGVSQDSAVNGGLHIRNEHANVGYRINGVLLPDSVASMGQVLDSSFIGSINVLTGALPAQFGMRTAGVVDIQTRNDAFNNTGRTGVYGGSRQTISPSAEYGGTVGQTQYFLTGRYFANNLGIENTTSSVNAIHDYTNQGKFFGYASTLLEDNGRLTFLTGSAVSRFQIPNIPGQPTVFPLAGIPNDDSGLPIFNSAGVNERQWERSYYGVLAWQKSVGDVDVQVSYFSRYNSVHFVPDSTGDLIFNGVASDISRNALVNGIQADAAYHLNDTHTIRTGMVTSGERTNVTNSSLVFPGSNDPAVGPIPSSDMPIGVFDANSKTGWLFGLYVQDEWKLTDKLTLNTGLRFDQMWQFVDANQFSPRVNLVYKPFETTNVHVGYARYFTPPVQAIATPANFAIFNGTVNEADPNVPGSSPMLPERSHVFDVGVTQKFGRYQVGVDAYYKLARDLIDDGQFGAARVLTGFNYDKGYNWGLELSNVYTDGRFNAYLNVAWATQRAKNIVSNQQLFTADDLAFIASNYIYTDHAQTITVSAGASYLWDKTLLSAKVIAGSGLRSGDHNSEHLPFYSQVDVGASREFEVPGAKPFTLRFDIVNVFDTSYEIRDGSGIGVFAPQFGPRRGYYVGFSQKFGPG